MSSYNSRRKDYAKKLLDKHIKENFYPEATPEIKYHIDKKDGITSVDSRLIDYLAKETGLTSMQIEDLVIEEYNNFKKKYEHDKKIYNMTRPTYQYEFRKYSREYKKDELYKKNKLIMRIDQYSNYNLHESGELEIMYTEEELLEAVDILMEDYDLTEDEAIDILMEDYEEDFDDEELLEAVDILMEDYDLDEDEALDIVLESYYEDDFDDYEIDELSEAVDILMEDYNLTEDEAIDLLMEGKMSKEEKEERKANRKFMFNIVKQSAKDTFDRNKSAIAMGALKKGVDTAVDRAKKRKADKDLDRRIQQALDERKLSTRLKRKYKAGKESLRRTHQKLKEDRKRRMKKRLRRNRVKKVKKALHLK